MKNKPMALKDAVNDEEFLTMCLEICANDPFMFSEGSGQDEETEFEFERDAFFLASKVIVWYIMLGGEALKEEEVQDKFMEMVVDHILTKEVKKGNVEASFHNDGEIRYSITEQGKQVVYQSTSFMRNMQDKAKKKDEE